MFVTEDESMADDLQYARHCFAHADATIEAPDLDAEVSVPWWPDRRRVTLGRPSHMA